MRCAVWLDHIGAGREVGIARCEAVKGNGHDTTRNGYDPRYRWRRLRTDALWRVELVVTPLVYSVSLSASMVADQVMSCFTAVC